MTQHPLQGTPAAHAANKPVQTMSGSGAAHTVGHKSFAVLFMWVFPKIGFFTPQIIHFNRVFPYVHHPFWGSIIFGNTHVPQAIFPWWGPDLKQLVRCQSPCFPRSLSVHLVPYRLEAVLQTKFRGSDGTNTHGSNEMSDTQSFFGWLPSREQSKPTNQLANQSGPLLPKFQQLKWRSTAIRTP